MTSAGPGAPGKSSIRLSSTSLERSASGAAQDNSEVPPSGRGLRSPGGFVTRSRKSRPRIHGWDGTWKTVCARARSAFTIRKRRPTGRSNRSADDLPKNEGDAQVHAARRVEPEKRLSLLAYEAGEISGPSGYDA